MPKRLRSAAPAAPAAPAPAAPAAPALAAPQVAEGLQQVRATIDFKGPAGCKQRAATHMMVKTVSCTCVSCVLSPRVWHVWQHVSLSPRRINSPRSQGSMRINHHEHAISYCVHEMRWCVRASLGARVSRFEFLRA